MKPININVKKVLTRIVPIGLILFGISACSVSQNTAREYDGIYYDPTAEPERRVADNTYYSNDQTPQEPQPVRIGGRYFDDGGSAPQVEEYQEINTYTNDRNVVSNQSDHVQWGEYQGVDIYVNNFYGWNRPYYSGWYSPRWNWRFGWSSGWNSWGYSPWYSSYYGFGFPHYGYGGFYGPYHPYGYGYGYGYNPYYSGYYGGYYGGYYPYYNNYYGNRVMREVTRGRGISNGVTRDNMSGQRNINNANRESAVRRNVSPTTQVTPQTRTRVNNEVNNTNINTPNRRNEANISNQVESTTPVRIRPRTTEEVNTNSGVRSNPNFNTPRPTTPNIRQRATDDVYQQTPTRPDTRYNTPRNQPEPRQRNVSPPPTRNQNVTPSRTPSSRSNSSIQSSPSRSSSMGSGARSSGSGGRSGGGVRR